MRGIPLRGRLQRGQQAVERLFQQPARRSDLLDQLCSQRHVRALEPGQDSVLEVPLETLEQSRKILWIADIFRREARMNALSQVEHLALLLLDKLKHEAVDRL